MIALVSLHGQDKPQPKPDGAEVLYRRAIAELVDDCPDEVFDVLTSWRPGEPLDKAHAEFFKSNPKAMSSFSSTP